MGSNLSSWIVFNSSWIVIYFIYKSWCRKHSYLLVLHKFYFFVQIHFKAFCKSKGELKIFYDKNFNKEVKKLRLLLLQCYELQ